MLNLLNRFSRKFYRIFFWCWFALLTLASVWPFNPNTNIIIKGFKIRLDYLEHTIIYAVLGFMFVLSSKVRISNAIVALATIVGFTYGFLMEYIQTFLPGRAYNVYDMLFNLIGLAVGLSMAYFYYDKKMLYRTNMQFQLSKNPMDIEDKSYQKVVVYFNPEKYKSVYDTSSVIEETKQLVADGGELIVMAPGVNCFSSDGSMDLSDLGSSNMKFNIVYCSNGQSKNDIESMGFRYGDIKEKMMLYNPSKLKAGINTFRCGTQIYFINIL